MAQDDYQRGRNQGGYEYGNRAYNDGARDRANNARLNETPIPRAPAPPSHVPALAPIHSEPQYPNLGARASRTSSKNSARVAESSATFMAAARGFAIAGSALAAAYEFYRVGSSDWAGIAAYAVGGAIIGGIAGVALYAALKLTIFLAKVAFGLLVVGIVLHLFGYIDLPRTLAAGVSLVEQMTAKPPRESGARKPSFEPAPLHWTLPVQQGL